MERVEGAAHESNRVELARIGRDPDQFEAFYREHLEAVSRFVARRVDDPHRAADLTAEVFLALIEHSGSYRAERGSPIAWLFGVARNVVAAEGRRSARERRLAAKVSGRRLLDPDSLTRIEERIDAERETRRVFDALSGLRERDRRLVELVAVDGLTVADAAAALGLTPGAARVRLHRSRAALKSLLAADSSVVAITLPEVWS